MGEHRHHLYPLLLLAVALLSCTAAASNITCPVAQETQYLLTFLAPSRSLLPSPDDLSLCLVLTNPSATTSLEMQVEPHNLSVTLLPRQINAQVCFNRSAAPDGSKKQTDNAGLLITAKHCQGKELVVHGSVDTRLDSVQANAAFTVSPVTSLGTRYVVVTHCETHHCFLGVVARGKTHVTVKLRLDPSNATLVYDERTYLHGDAIEEDLERLEVMQVLCEVCDMSGSLVTSTAPVAVLSGGEFTTMGQHSKERPDTALEYIPPVNALGTRHVIIKDQKASYTLKVVATEKNTVFFVPALGKCFAANATGDTWTLPLSEKSTSTVLNSTHPVLVSLLITPEDDDSRAARMTLVQPMSQWSKSYEVVQAFVSVVNYLYLVGHSLDFDRGCFLFNGSMLNLGRGSQVNSAVDGSSTLKAVRMALSPGVHHNQLICNPGCGTYQPFWGYVDGMKDRRLRGWALPLGTFTASPEQWDLTPFPSDEVKEMCTTEFTNPGITTIIPTSQTVKSDPLISLDTTTATTSFSRMIETDPLTSAPKNTKPTTPYIGLLTKRAATKNPRSSGSTDRKVTSPTQSTFIPDTTSPPPPLETSPSQDNTSSTRKKAMCPCQCRHTGPTISVEDHGLLVLVETSRQRNRKQSAPDKRLSATVMGFAGVSILVSVSLVIVCSDVTSWLGMTNKSSGFGFQGKGRRMSEVRPRH